MDAGLICYRLRAEKEALEILLRAPQMPTSRQIDSSIFSKGDLLDRSLLSEADIAALENSTPNPTSPTRISERLNVMYQALGPNIDKFADGIHTMGQFREAADNVAGRTLAICAERLAQREKEGRKRVLPAGPGSPPKDLGGVLRSLSRAER
jgi:kinetochore protein Mis13/DSN1